LTILTITYAQGVPLQTHAHTKPRSASQQALRLCQVRLQLGIGNQKQGICHREEVVDIFRSHHQTTRPQERERVAGISKQPSIANVHQES